MKKVLWLILLAVFVLTACTVLPRQTDAADEAILRVVTVSRQGEELKLVAMTAGIKTADSQQDPERVEGSGGDYWSARRAMEEKREGSMTHASDWVVERSGVTDALEAFTQDPELTYDARIYLLEEQSAEEFLKAFEEESSGPAKALDDLGRALEEKGVTMLRLSRALAAGEGCLVPVVKGEAGQVEVTDFVELTKWA